MNLRDTYEKIAADWHTDHLSDEWWKDGLDVFSKFLPPGGKVLDVGCAGGVKSRAFIERGFDVMGIDFSSNFIEIARKEAQKGIFQVLDIRKDVYPDTKFDGIFMQAVLLHIPKKEVVGILKKFEKILSLNGFIYIAVKELREGQPEEEIVRENDYGYDYERFFSYYTQNELEDMLRSFGMKICFSNVSAIGRTKWVQVIGQKETL